MSKRPGLFSEISWFQVAASVLAAVTAAWIASSLGVAGTLIGAALGSFVVTISTAFYGRTLDKGKTLIVQTAAGTTVEQTLVDGEIAEAIREVEELDHSPVRRAEVVDGGPRRLHWKTILATTAVVLGLSVAAMGAYELVTDDSFGASDNARIGNPFGSSDGSVDPTPTPSADESATTPTPSATTATPEPTPPPAPSPTPTTVEPTPTESTPTPTPTPTDATE